MHKSILATSAASLLAALACTAPTDTSSNRRANDGSTPSVIPATTSQDIRVTREGHRGPQACRPQRVGATVAGFFGAVNRGDSDRALAFFTRDFRWYSVTEGDPQNGGRHFVAGDLNALDDYFHERVNANERMFLLEIDVGYERARDVVHVAYNLLRTADDLTEYAAQAGGKGAIDCDSGRIAVWSMAQGPKPLLVGELCPGKADPPEIALACARK